MPKAYKPTAPYERALDTPLLQKKEYFISKTEWALNGNRQIIYKQKNITGTGFESVYKVPDGHFLFITYAHLHGNGNGVYTVGSEDIDTILSFTIVDTFSMVENVSNLIRIPPGNTIYFICAGATGNLEACFYGFLERI